MKTRNFKVDDVVKIASNAHLGQLKGAIGIIELTYSESDTNGFDYLISITKYSNGDSLPEPQLEKVYEHEIEKCSSTVLTTTSKKSLSMRLLLMGA